jgi:hypothetical protein
MKKLVISMALLAVAVVAFNSAGSVFAQTDTPQTPTPPAVTPGTTWGILHDEMVAVFAEKLGLTVDDINTRLTAGETMAQIAYSTGMSASDFRTLMTDVRTKAIDLAVKNGTITQEQADWMNTRGNGMMRGGAGPGRGARGAGAGYGNGTGPGRYANPGCPYYTGSTN